MDSKARYRFKNRLTLSAKEAKRRAGPAAPPWLTEEQDLIVETIYAEAEQRSVWTGIPFEVDHIIPLKGRCPITGERNICGLHVYWNLRPVPMQLNRDKSDFFHTDWPKPVVADTEDPDDIPF